MAFATRAMPPGATPSLFGTVLPSAFNSWAARNLHLFEWLKKDPMNRGCGIQTPKNEMLRLVPLMALRRATTVGLPPSKETIRPGLRGVWLPDLEEGFV
jgi:hypothetical protein